MGIFSVVGKAVGATANYAGARSKERSTIFGGGLCAIVLYFRVNNPKAVDETMFYIVFTVGLLLAFLKSDFMKRMGELAVEKAKNPRGRKRKK